MAFLFWLFHFQRSYIKAPLVKRDALCGYQNTNDTIMVAGELVWPSEAVSDNKHIRGIKKPALKSAGEVKRLEN